MNVDNFLRKKKNVDLSKTAIKCYIRVRFF